MKCLIIGGGNAALRYIESLIWGNLDIFLCGTCVKGKTEKLAHEFGLPYITFQELKCSTINSFECVIVCLPPEIKLHYVIAIVDELQYRGTLILEKPLAIHYDDLHYYRMLMSRTEPNCSCLCLRDLLPETYGIQPKMYNEIVFYSEFVDLKSNIINQLPHILSWLYSYGCQVDSLAIKGDAIYGNSNNRIFLISFGREMPGVLINGVRYPPLNYRKHLLTIVKSLMIRDARLIRAELGKAIWVAERICKLLVDMPRSD